MAYQLAQSHRLRVRVGLDAINHILPFATATERREIASRLVEDVLRTQGPLQFALRSGESPAMDEALNLARVAADLAPEDDVKLLTWLESRRGG